jgi:hypothetical protein
VLPLPGQARPPAAPPPDDARGPGRRRRLGVAAGALAAAAVLGGALLPGAGTAPPPLVTDVVTEDAVVAVLRLFAAEAALADPLADPAAPFALPGPAGRAAALRDAAAAARAEVAALRDARVGPGTPAEDYAASPDHDALLQVVDDLVRHTEVVAGLEEVHATVTTGAAVTTPAEAAAAVDRAAAEARPALRAWAQALQAALARSGDAAQLAAARAAAQSAWRADADRVAPAALGDLTAFLSGIDPGVLAALDGHPVAGPALDRLRR